MLVQHQRTLVLCEASTPSTTSSTRLFPEAARTSPPRTLTPRQPSAYWSHRLEFLAHVAGTKLAWKMLTTQPTIFEGELEPGVNVDTDAKIEEWMCARVTGDNHATGSLSMLLKSLSKVVDTKLRIYGTRNVRVTGAIVDVLIGLAPLY
ncbi:hypothetical protein HGRIS_013963 [Hohenbuehelia grisea]|uniref:Glucose-methanol-choline oxidoreductase C-terminal domain-containing protein n=1 Tax=Hohenbuehelia grisea TaxID=104357 RepID=A0ABR3JSR8_9AGAR